MPITDSGLWVPRDYRPKPSFIRRVAALLGKNASFIASLAAISISVSALAFTIFSAVAAQRAYLSYAVSIDDSDLKRALDTIGACVVEPVSDKFVARKDLHVTHWNHLVLRLALKATNLGNTPAANVIFHMSSIGPAPYLPLGTPRDLAVQPILIQMAPKESMQF